MCLYISHTLYITVTICHLQGGWEEWSYIGEKFLHTIKTKLVLILNTLKN